MAYTSVIPVHRLDRSIEYVKDKEFAINVISKSGTTTETSIAFRIFKDLLETTKGKDVAQRRIVATTDKETSASTIATALAVFCILTTSFAIFSLTSQNKSYSSEYNLSSAPSITSSRCFNSSVV